MPVLPDLERNAETIRAELERINSARDVALARSRELIRVCAAAIKAVHRANWEEAEQGLMVVQRAAYELIEGLHDYPDLYQAGYTQDALKEYVEAFAIYSLVRDRALPDPQQLRVTGATYLNGLAEAASELRRSTLDIIRHGHSQQAEHLLEAMDGIYNLLMTFDFPDAITYGLRRRVDNLRGVLERTRGDLTSSLRQEHLQAALNKLEQKLSLSAEYSEAIRLPSDEDES